MSVEIPIEVVASAMILLLLVGLSLVVVSEFIRIWRITSFREAVHQITGLLIPAGLLYALLVFFLTIATGWLILT